MIIDDPPGSSCFLVASINRSNFCILVTEPTPFGLNDLSLAVEVLRKLKILLMGKHYILNKLLISCSNSSFC